MNKITGTIITLNAEKYILRAIESLKNISDEIIVLDSKSTDSTIDIARLLEQKSILRSFWRWFQKKRLLISRPIAGFLV